MNRPDLISELQRLIKSGEMVSIEGYRYSLRKSRTTAVKELSDESVWARIEYDKNRFLFIKK